jgi:hypothetical protein
VFAGCVRVGFVGSLEWGSVLEFVLNFLGKALKFFEFEFFR